MRDWSIDRQSIAAAGCLITIVAAILAIIFKDGVPWLVSVPESLRLPISDWVNAIVSTSEVWLRPFFRLISSALDWQMRGLQSVFLGVPWSAMLVFLTLATLRIAGPRIAVLTTFTCFYIVAAGYWKESIATLTLVSLGLPIACVLGGLLGVLAHASRRMAPIVEIALDVMQTVPAFAYLTPLIVLFGFGPVAGLIASVLFSLPPMARNVKIGLDNTPNESVEAAEMAGCSRLQIFGMVRWGAATRQILMGINQTIMATLSMVIFAAVIGGFEDIGWEVLRAARKAEFGNGILAGIVVTLIAILLDRTSEAAFVRRERHVASVPSHIYWAAAILLSIATAILISPLLPSLTDLSLRRSVAPEIDQAVTSLSLYLTSATDGLKRIATIYFLLPLRIGIVNTATAGIWGFELSPFATGAYAAAVTIIASILAFRSHFGGAFAVLFAGILLYTGFIGLPWLPLIAGVTLIGWRLGGIQLGVMTLAGLGLIAAGGLWQSAMFSAYLMAAAIATSIIVGGGLGIAAAEFAPVSRAIRPLNDFLQTIPPFVILIPLIMFFQVGDFSSYLAIVAYAIVPMIRYTELGLRGVPATQIEAGEFAGCTRLQLLAFVKLPAAHKELLLGLNQTVMSALAMLAVAALVGSRGLGQDVYVALSKADPGFGLLAGLSIAILAMLSDRFIRHAAG